METRPTHAQGCDNYRGGLDQMERSSPFPTNDLVLCCGKGFRIEQRSLFYTTRSSDVPRDKIDLIYP